MTTGSNLSVFDHNVLHAFAGAADDAEILDVAATVYLRGVDRDPRRAERAALDTIAVVQTIRPMIAAAVEIYRADDYPRFDGDAGVTAFIIERIFRRHFPGN